MRSPTYEAVLKRQGVSFTYLPRLDLEAIDVQASLRNQARLLNPLEDELIDQYSGWYKEGIDGPPLVVYEKKRAKRTWIIMDGNQRSHAARKAGLKTLDAYSVETTDPMVIDRITWSFNNLVNGKRLTREEALAHAVSMVEKYNLDNKTAADEFGVHTKAVQQKVLANKLRRVLHENKANEATKLSDEKLEDLNSLRSLGDEVFTAAATTAQKCGLTRMDILTLKDDVKKAKTNDEKIEAVAKFADSDLAKQRRAETKGGTVKASATGISPAERLVQHLKVIARLLDTYDKTSLRRMGAHYQETLELATEVVDRLIILYGLGSRPPKHQEAV